MQVGIMGAGVAANEAEAFFTGKGYQITAGAVQSVGLAGGYGQGGGHGGNQTRTQDRISC